MSDSSEDGRQATEHTGIDKDVGFCPALSLSTMLPSTACRVSLRFICRLSMSFYHLYLYHLLSHTIAATLLQARQAASDPFKACLLMPATKTGLESDSICLHRDGSFFILKVPFAFLTYKVHLLQLWSCLNVVIGARMASIRSPTIGSLSPEHHIIYRIKWQNSAQRPPYLPFQRLDCFICLSLCAVLCLLCALHCAHHAIAQLMPLRQPPP